MFFFKYGGQRRNGGCQTDVRQSDSFIVPKKPVISVEGRGLHNNGLSEGTSAVLRGGGTDENEIRENSRQIGS